MIPENDLASGCLDMIAKTLESFGCCHGHDGKSSPPMMYSEWIACCIRHHILAERERCAKVDFTEIIWGVLKEHKKSKRLALHDLHVMHVRLAAAIRRGPTDDRTP